MTKTNTVKWLFGIVLLLLLAAFAFVMNQDLITKIIPLTILSQDTQSLLELRSETLSVPGNKDKVDNGKTMDKDKVTDTDQNSPGSDSSSPELEGDLDILIDTNIDTELDGSSVDVDTVIDVNTSAGLEANESADVVGDISTEINLDAGMSDSSNVNANIDVDVEVSIDIDVEAQLP